MKIKAWLKMTLLFFVVCIVLIVGCSLLVMRGSQMPTDASLVRQFESNKEAFEEMKKMLQVDQRVGGVSSRGVCNTNIPIETSLGAVGISEDRYQKYLTLLKQTGAKSFIREERDNGIREIRFLVAGWGALDVGWQISIMWTEVEPKPLITNLDDLPKETSRVGHVAYRPLGDNWYLRIGW
jgi:hypothetical protein